MVGQPGAPRPDRSLTLIIAGYVTLWIIEGALRKWVPGAGGLFYIARDMGVMAAFVWIRVTASPVRALPWYVILALSLGLAWAAANSVVVGQTSAPVFLMGLDTYVAPGVLVALAYQYLPAQFRLRAISRPILLAVPLELLVTAIQVASPSSAWINALVSSDASTLTTADGVVRASGTYSSPLGLTAFLALALVFALADVWVRSTFLGWVAVVSIIVTSALSGSRGSILSTGLLVTAFLVPRILGTNFRGFSQAVLLAGLVAASVVFASWAMPTVFDAFIGRFVSANASENSGQRLIDQFVGFVPQSFPLFGSGIGTRSNAGIALGSSAGWVENDNLRWVAELGVLGYVLALTRVVAAAVLVLSYLRHLRAWAPVLLLSTANLAMTLVIGSVNEIPTSAGAFAIGCAALLIEMKRQAHGDIEGDASGTTLQAAVLRPSGAPRRGLLARG